MTVYLIDGRALVEQQEQWTANRRFIFSSPRPALRARVALRAKYRIRPAWLIRRLSCRLLPSEMNVRIPCAGYFYCWKVNEKKE